MENVIFCAVAIGIFKIRSNVYDEALKGPKYIFDKCPNTELFLVRIFLYSDCIRRFAT